MVSWTEVTDLSHISVHIWTRNIFNFQRGGRKIRIGEMNGEHISSRESGNIMRVSRREYSQELFDIHLVDMTKTSSCVKAEEVTLRPRDRLCLLVLYLYHFKVLSQISGFHTWLKWVISTNWVPTWGSWNSNLLFVQS